MTLTSDIISRIIVSRAYRLYMYCIIWGRNFKFGEYRCNLGRQNGEYHFYVTLTLISDLIPTIMVSGAYLLYYLR